MSRLGRNLVALCAALALFAAIVPSAPLAAQELEAGLWTGSITTPDAAFDVSFEVSGEGDELAVTMVIETGETMPFDTVEWADGTLSLGFVLPGVSVECELEEADDGSYEGECMGSDGNAGAMQMIPPAGD